MFVLEISLAVLILIIAALLGYAVTPVLIVAMRRFLHGAAMKEEEAENEKEKS